MKGNSFVLSIFVPLFAARVVLSDPAQPDSARPVSHIPREHVESSTFRSVGFSKRRHILEIEFINGAIYRYLDVPPSVYYDLMSADSKARYYDRNIRRKYHSMRVRSRVKDQPGN